MGADSVDDVRIETIFALSGAEVAAPGDAVFVYFGADDRRARPVCE